MEERRVGAAQRRPGRAPALHRQKRRQDLQHTNPDRRRRRTCRSSRRGGSRSRRGAGRIADEISPLQCERVVTRPFYTRVFVLNLKNNCRKRVKLAEYRHGARPRRRQRPSRRVAATDGSGNVRDGGFFIAVFDQEFRLADCLKPIFYSCKIFLKAFEHKTALISVKNRLL